MATISHEMTNAHPHGTHERQCPHCQRVFMTDNSLIRYCSTTCKIRMSAKRAYERGTRVRRKEHHIEGGQYKRTCKHCGTEFRSNSKQAKYCSEDHRQASYNARYYKRHKKKIVKRVIENRRAKRQQELE